MYDIRDSSNNEYIIRKLADGNCWMTQNLRIVGPKTLTAADSDVTIDFDLTASDDSTWCGDYTQACIDQTMVIYSGNPVYGMLYNWYAATAGTGTISIASSDATGSICPKGWHLPTVGENTNDFQAIYNSYNSSTLLLESPANFILSGVRDGSATDTRGVNGNYWSKSAVNNNFAFGFNLTDSAVNTRFGGRKYRGFAVRCLANY